jgi:hypothetical protein
MLSKVANVRGDENEVDCLNEAEDVGACSAIFSASMSNRERDMTIKRVCKPAGLVRSYAPHMESDNGQHVNFGSFSYGQIPTAKLNAQLNF